MTTLEPCKAGFDGCLDMRAEAVRKHPRTPRLAECHHYPIPSENPDKLQGPAVGALCRYLSRSGVGEIVRVTARSYVWAPGERTGSRRYDLKVIERQTITDGAFVGTGRTLLVDDKDLSPVDPGGDDAWWEGRP